MRTRCIPASYCEYLEARGFEGISDGDAVANYARYIEDLTYGLTVNVKSAAEAMKLDRTYDISTLRSPARAETSSP